MLFVLCLAIQERFHTVTWHNRLHPTRLVQVVLPEVLILIPERFPNPDKSRSISF